MGMALMSLFRAHAWTHLAILTSDTSFGRNGVRTFVMDAVVNGWRVPAMETFRVGDANDSDRPDVSLQLRNIHLSGMTKRERERFNSLSQLFPKQLVSYKGIGNTMD